MSWDAYVTDLLRNDGVAEAAIWGYITGSEGQWATSQNLKISVDEVKKLVSKDRSSFSISGCYVGGMKCMMIRDNLDLDGSCTMDLKTSKDSEGNSFSIVVGKTKQALVFVKGKKDVGVGQLNPIVYKMVEYLTKSGY